MNGKIYEFTKNQEEKVIIEFTTYEGIELVSARVFRFDSISEVWKPTHKGIALKRPLLQELKKGIDRAFELWKDGSLDFGDAGSNLKDSL